MGMDMIRDKLYLGGVVAAHDPEKLQKLGITHVLTIDAKDIPAEAHKDMVHKYVRANDMYDTDLLSHFQECFQFIDEGLAAGGVYVHCYMGQSRSGTIVVAYIMNKERIGLKEALEIVQQERKQVCPNPGFMEQLQQFEEMGCHIDLESSVYKLYKLNLLSSKIQNAEVSDSQSIPNECLRVDPSQASSSSEPLYKCRKCRRLLFKSSAVLTHEVGIGEAAFDWRAKATSLGEEPNMKCRTSLFIEPIQWMQEFITVVEGKICCPKCSAKLGSFNWAGVPCACGTWVAPAFHVQANKVDLSQPRSLPMRVGRVPPLTVTPGGQN